ncbi:hypothetical protein STEG23_013527, partial [Scotinomys teguina]
ASDWKLDQPDWTGRLRITSKGKVAYIKLEDKVSGELFAQAPVEQYPGIAVETVTDSSRYFVIRIQDGTGRSAFIGIGFTDRGDAFDFNVSLQDHFKWVKQETEISKESQEMDNRPKLDLGFKEGQTIKLSIGNITTKKGGASKPRATGTGGLSLLPPPPGGKVTIPPPSSVAISNHVTPPPIPKSNHGGSDADILLDLDSPAPVTTSAPAPVSTSSDLWGDFSTASSPCFTVFACISTRTGFKLDFITKILDPKAAYYIGLSDPGHRQWRWVDQTPCNENSTFWHLGEPNYDHEQCVIINHRNFVWGWNDTPCSDKQKSDFITKILDPKAAYYIGLSDPGHRQWRWVDQTPYNEIATFWHPGEPNYDYEKCVIINHQNFVWGWNDTPCSDKQKSDFITKILDPKAAYYIGLSDPGHRQWRWVDQTPYNEIATITVGKTLMLFPLFQVLAPGVYVSVLNLRITKEKHTLHFM